MSAETTTYMMKTQAHEDCPEKAECTAGQAAQVKQKISSVEHPKIPIRLGPT